LPQSTDERRLDNNLLFFLFFLEVFLSLIRLIITLVLRRFHGELLVGEFPGDLINFQHAGVLVGVFVFLVLRLCG
jgi:hypothetical protein